MAVHERRIPEWVRHAPTPGVRAFASLGAMEAAARGVLISVFPVAMYEALGDAETVSEIYFLVGAASLFAALFVPMLARRLSRRAVYSAGALLMAAGAGCAGLGGPLTTPVGLGVMTIAVVVTFICYNAYVLDYIERADLGACETQRLFYSGLAWGVGPLLGVWLMGLWRPAPFILSVVSALLMLALFWRLRLSDRPQIAAATRPPPAPHRYIRRFFRQPRLVAGWLFAVVRSSGWWVYVVYLPIYAVERGFPAGLGGAMLSATNFLLLAAPLMLAWMRRRSVRIAVRTGFLGAALCFGAAFALADAAPVLALAALGLASAFLILLDVSGGLPFLMAVRAHERSEMSAIYASYRDVSGIATPGAVRLILFAAPLTAVFGAAAAALAAMWLLAGRLHPRLGATKGPRAAPEPIAPRIDISQSPAE